MGVVCDSKQDRKTQRITNGRLLVDTGLSAFHCDDEDDGGVDVTLKRVV